MGIAELQSQIGSLECGIVSKRASISRIDAKTAAINEARKHAVIARDEAESLVRTASYFALAGWAGTHADSFMNGMSPGGSVRNEAVTMHTRCVQLVESMNAQLGSLQSERSAIRRSIARDQRSIEQARSSMDRLRRRR